MTKKDRTIRNIIAGLTILILGGLAVYFLVPSASTNSPDKNQEKPQQSENGPEKKKPKPQAVQLSEYTLSSSGEERSKNCLSGEKRFKKGVFLASIVYAAYMGIVILPADKDEIHSPKYLQENYAKYWMVFTLLAFCLGCLSDKLPVPYLDQFLSDLVGYRYKALSGMVFIMIFFGVVKFTVPSIG